MGKEVHGVYIMLGLLFLTLIAVAFLYKLGDAQTYLNNVNNFSVKNAEKICIDGTSSGECSPVRPFYCDDKGNLIENCKSCGCKNDFYCVNSTCVSCKEKWTCSEFLDCVNKKQKRTCFDLNNCGTNLLKPLEEQSCSNCKESWFCGDWSNCLNKKQTRKCFDSNICGTFSKKPLIEQSC